MLVRLLTADPITFDPKDILAQKIYLGHRKEREAVAKVAAFTHALRS